MNSKTLTLVLLTLCLLLAAMMTRNGDLAWMALPFLLYLGIGILQIPTPGSIKLAATRKVNSRRLDGSPTIDVEVKVSNQGVNIDHLYLEDTQPDGIKVSSGQISQHVALRRGNETTLKYSLEERRGDFSWAMIQAVVSDPLGLVATEFSLPARASLQVQPERTRFGRLSFRPRSTLHSPGSIPARLGGSGTDFWGVREYHPGDSLRWLDWRLTARHPRQFFTKEFEQEEIADIGIILDARQKSDLRIGEDSLFEHAVGATSSLAEVFLQQGHRVSLLVYSGSTIPVFPGYGKVQLNKILRCLAKIKTQTTNMADSLEYLSLQMFSSRALLIVISPLAQKDWPFFPRLRAYGYQGLLISPNPFDYLTQLYEQDLTSTLALRSAHLERRLELRDIAQLQIPVIDWHVHQPLYPLVRSALTRTRGQREL